MDDATMDATPNGRRRIKADGFDRAREAMLTCAAEAWERFVAAIDETGGDEAASVGVTLKYVPGGSEKPDRLVVQGKAALPTSRVVFTARRSGGQLDLLIAGDDEE